MEQRSFAAAPWEKTPLSCEGTSQSRPQTMRKLHMSDTFL